MPLVNVRTFLRDPKRVFVMLETMLTENGTEPVVLIRNGVPVAILSPVRPDDAAGIAMAALPEWTERRARAAESHREGRTIASETLRAEGESAGALLPSEANVDDVLEDVAMLFGPDVASRLGEEVTNVLWRASEPAVVAVAGAEAPGGASREEVAGHVRALSNAVFRSLLPSLYQTRLATLAETVHVGGPGGLGRGTAAHRAMAEAVIRDAAERVGELNRDLAVGMIGAGELSLASYKTFVAGATLGKQTGPRWTLLEPSSSEVGSQPA